MGDALFTAMDHLIFQPVEMAVRSNNESSGPGPSNMVQNLEQKYFTADNENNPLSLSSSWTDLNVDQNRNDETCIVQNFEDSDFSALRPNYDRRAHTHHMVTRYDAPQNRIHEFLTGWTPLHNNPLPQQFNQPQKNTTHITWPHITNGWTITAETKHRRWQSDQQTCWGNCRHCFPILKANVVSTTQAKNNDYTNSW